MNLHGQMMNLQPPPGFDHDTTASERVGYVLGHRDARHTAAELAATVDSELDRLWIAVEEARMVMLVEDSIRPEYGWAEWVHENMPQRHNATVQAAGEGIISPVAHGTTGYASADTTKGNMK